MLRKDLNDITCDDIQKLIGNKISENRSLEYKRDAVGSNDKSKKEFLKDVSSMANTIGGDILYGIEEEKGCPAKIVGVGVENKDEEIRRLEALLRDGIQPRIPSVKFQWVDCDDRNVLVVRVLRSWISPHRVTVSHHGHFYLRHSNHVGSMDVEQLRQAFTFGHGLKQQVVDFHRDRLAVIELNELPVNLIPGAKSVLHLIPFESFARQEIIQFGDTEIAPIPGTPAYGLPTFEGPLWRSNADRSADQRAYTLLFRNGILESCHKVVESGNIFDPDKWCDQYKSGIDHFLSSMDQLNLAYPYYLICSLIGMKCIGMNGTVEDCQSRPLKQEILKLSSIFLEDKRSVEAGLNAMRNQLQNAFGYPDSPIRAKDK